MLNSKKLFSNTILYSIGEIVPRILSLVLLPILTTYLSTKEYGINSYTTSVMTFVFVIASLSLNTYILKYYYNEDSLEGRKNLVGSIFYFILLFNVLLLLFQFIVIPKLIGVFNVNIPFYPFFFLAILNNFFDVISIIPLVMYRVNENAKGFIIVSLSRTILQYILVLILVVHYRFGLEGSYYGRLLVNIPYVFIYFYYIRNNGFFKIDWSVVKSALRFSLPLLPGGISYLLISLSDRVILERYISLEQLGIYSVASTLALALNVVIQALYKTIEPILFKEYYSDNFQSINLLLYRIYLSLLLIGAFFAAIFSKEVFLIAASHAFSSGYKIVPFLTIPVVISGINTYLDILLIAEKKQKVVSYTTILSGIISVSINFILIPKLGYYGAIIASTTAFLIVNIICHYNLIIKTRYLVSQLVLIALVAFMPYVYDTFISQSNLLLNLLLKFFVFLVFTIIALKLLNISIRRFKNQFIGLIK
jgi:O-antigen/teichoic acid export membrane protein